MARDEDPESADLARERDLEWQRIIDNFGDRATLDPEDEPVVEAVPAPSRDDADSSDDLGDRPEIRDQVAPDDEFVPPTPPPVPRPPLDRLLAWLGVFGIPAFVLFCIVAGITLPAWVGLLMAAGFVGGFGYLVLQMSNEPRPPWDDGAVL